MCLKVDAKKLLGPALRTDLGVMPELSEIENHSAFHAALDVELCDRPGDVSAGKLHDEVQRAGKRGSGAAGRELRRRIHISP